MAILSQYFAKVGDLVKTGYRSNAFSPLVWFDAIVLPPLLYFAYQTKGSVTFYILLGVICLIVLFSMCMYLVIFLKDPKLLQSENYRIEDRKLDIIQQKGSSIEINPVDLTTPSGFLEEGGQNE